MLRGVLGGRGGGTCIWEVPPAGNGRDWGGEGRAGGAFILGFFGAVPRTRPYSNGPHDSCMQVRRGLWGLISRFTNLSCNHALETKQDGCVHCTGSMTIIAVIAVSVHAAIQDLPCTYLSHDELKVLSV